MINAKIHRLIVPALILFVLPIVARADVTLVKDGQAQAEIVADVASSPVVKLAAEDLQKHIQLMSGARLEIVNVPSGKFKNFIYAGPGHAEKLGVTVNDLKVGGFKIIARDNYVLLAGHDELWKRFPYSNKQAWQEFAGEAFSLPQVGPEQFNEELGINVNDATATLYASSELLEQLGVRWYAPYENGTIIPEQKTIVVRDQALTKEPAFPHRDFTYYGWMRSDSAGIMWFKHLKYGISYPYYCNHTTWDIISEPEQRERHPEYYALSEGKPIGGMGDRGVPRLCDEGFRKASVKYLGKVFDAYPSLFAMSVGMPDGFTQIDDRDAEIWSRPGRGYVGKFSDYVWDYWLHVAAELKKTHPEKYLSCISYTTFEEPPSQVEKLPDNITLHMAYPTATLFLPQEQARLRNREKWFSMLTSKKFYVFDHYLFYSEGRPRYPVFFTKLLQEDMRSLAGMCEGKFIEVAPNVAGPDRGKLACPGLTHMLHYWQGKLYWDPNMDRQTMLDEYYELYFGPAKAEMKEFYEFAESVWMRPETRSVTMYTGFLKEADAARYFEILGRARAKAGEGTVYDERIAQIESEMQPLKTFFADIRRVGPDFSLSIKDAQPELDGSLNEPFWEEGVTWYQMKNLITGDDVPDESSTRVAITMLADNSALIIGVECLEPNMDKIVTKAKYQDDFSIFDGDILEVYIETPERSFFKIGVDPNGMIWDETQDVTLIARDTLPTLWNPGTRVAVVKGVDRWTAEIMIPAADFGAGPSKEKPWGINVGRARFAEAGIPCYAISPTGMKRFLVLSKLGNLMP